jgi:hypothetical protein
MLSKFISDKSFGSIGIEYPYDSDFEIKNIQTNVDGNLNFNTIPSFQGTKDIRSNNYNLTILSRNDHLNSFLDFKKTETDKNGLFYIYNANYPEIDENTKVWKKSNFNLILEQDQELDSDNIFYVDFVEEGRCQIYHENNDEKYILCFSLNLSALKFVSTNAENIENFNTVFDYVLNNNIIVFYSATLFGNYAIKVNGVSLSFQKTTVFAEDNKFYIKGKSDVFSLKNQNNWVSYQKNFNKNNLFISDERSHFGVKNNHLFTSTLNFLNSSISFNVMTLKNQLNQENDQSRGNVFLSENETNLREYEAIFTGGYREKGYDKINLGYVSYTIPFVFKSGKTTYFHVPHDIYPYEKLNINSSKIAESGAVGGNCPLNSDKIWKKLKNYRDTSPYSIPREENTGQWLCSWLSAGNPDKRPVWMDRYYKPSKTTYYEALSAISTEIVYKDSFDCLDLKNDVSDVKSSLTFEEGVYYAYMHLGKDDYQNLINESLSDKILYNKLDDYRKTNYLSLESFNNEYVFDGNNFGYLDSLKNIEKNNISFTFFLEKDDWDIPSGNLIFGNYVNNGFGFYNYNLNTQYVLLRNGKNSVSMLNNDYLKISNFTTTNLTLCSIVGTSRRNGLENLHFLTEDYKLIEMDLRGTIVDTNSAIKDFLSLDENSIVYSTTNDDNYFYIGTSNGNARFDLNNNTLSSVNIKQTIGNGTSFELLVDDSENLYKIYGKQPILRKENIYFLSGGEIFSYSTSLSVLSSYIQTNSGIDCFSITKDDEINIVSKNEFLIYEGINLKEKIILDDINEYSLSAIQISYTEKFEKGTLSKYKNIFCQNEEESYIIQFDKDYNKKTIKLQEKYNLVQDNCDITNYNHNIQCLGSTYKENTYHFKAKLLNKVDSEDYKEILFIIDSKDLSSGNRHFSINIDCYNGVANLYLDCELYKTIKFEQRKYILSKTFNGRIFYGSNGFFNGVPLFKQMKDPNDYVCSNFKLSENYIINKPLDRFESLYFYSIVYPPDDLVYNMPSSSRSFIDTMEKVFNFNIPMFKSNHFDLKILNSGIIYDDLKEELSNEIREKIKEFLPLYSIFDDIKWIETTDKKIIEEGNYNISNTLTNII